MRAALAAAAIAIKNAYAGYLDRLCAASGHFYGCRLLNERQRPFGAWHRFVGWLMEDYGEPVPEPTTTTGTPGATVVWTTWSHR